MKHITKLNGKSLTTSLRISIELGLVWQVAHGGYAPDHPWLSIAASRDRVWSGKPTGAFSRDKVAEYYAGRIGPHELGAVKLAGWFAAAGCPVAPGWRFRDVMGKHGQVAPDGMIYLRQSPFGATWFYLEYELRATGYQRRAEEISGLPFSPARRRFPGAGGLSTQRGSELST